MPQIEALSFDACMFRCNTTSSHINQDFVHLDCLHFINASVRSRKNIVKSAYSHLPYSKTAEKGKIIRASELLLFWKSISSTFCAHDLKLPFNRGLFVQNIAREN